MIRRALFTTQAVLAMLAGDDTCTPCSGTGRQTVNYPRERGTRVCPACRGDGIPPATSSAWREVDQQWMATVSRDEYKSERRPR
jgi:phage/plasmid primase-like uncharacterized protein